MLVLEFVQKLSGVYTKVWTLASWVDNQISPVVGSADEGLQCQGSVRAPALAGKVPVAHVVLHGTTR